MNLSHPVRLGLLRERQFLVGAFTSTYSTLVCNANLVVTYSSGVGGLLRQIVGRGSVDGFLVDPITHFLNVGREAILGPAGRIKPGLERLVQRYGLDDDVAATLPLDPDRAKSLLNGEFVHSVLEFQRNCIRQTVEKDREYIEYVDDSGTDLPAFDPCVLVAPYLFIPDNQQASGFLEVNAALYREAASKSGNHAAMLMVHSDCLTDARFVHAIASTYAGLEPSVLFVWVTSVDDHNPIIGRQQRNHLTSVYSLINQLTREGVKVVRAYSSFLPYSLRDDLVLGAIHGCGYGEYRDAVPVGGGLPAPKFYFPRIHKRISYTDAYRFIRNMSVEQYHSQICDCPQCRQLLSSGIEGFERYGEVETTIVTRREPRTDRISETSKEYASQQSLEFSTKHYMYCKHKEIHEISTVSRSEASRLLRTSFDSVRNTPLEPIASHLPVWADIVENWQ